MRHDRLWRGVTCVVAASIVAGCGSAAAAAAPSPRVGGYAGDVAPALTGTSLEGHHMSLAAWRGSVVVIVFWRSWCVPCEDEQPAVNALADALRPAGVHFAGVSEDVDGSAARAYLSRFAVPYDSLLDTQLTISYDFDAADVPTTYVINRSGRVADEVAGPVDIPTLRADIAAAQATA